MALTLDSTVGGASANSYLSVADADSYHEGRLHNSGWFEATTTNKEAALVWATSLLDGMEWQGYLASGTQRLRWPRAWVKRRDDFAVDFLGQPLTLSQIYFATDEIPRWLKEATAELAFWLLAEDRTADPDTAGFKSIKVSSIELDIDRTDRAKPIPDSVKRMIRPYVVGQGSIRLVRA